MHVKAFILFLCAVVYIVETSQIGYRNCTSPVAVKKTSTCCSAQKKCSKSDAGNSQSEDNKNDCRDMANCSNCPVCYTAIFPVNDLPGNVMMLLKRQYPVIQINYNSLYHGESWKPPDVIS